MITFGAARTSDREALVRLWLEAFTEDTEDDVNAFLSSFFKDGQALVARKNSEVVSMLFLLGQPLCMQETTLTAGYIYAGATARSHRGQGLYRRLLAFATQRARDRGMAALFLHPADKRLEQSYRRMGFSLPMTCSLCRRSANTASGIALTPTEYRAARQRALRSCGVPFIDWDEAVLAHVMTWCRAIGDRTSCALIGERDGELFAWECFGALPSEILAGRTVGDEDLVGLMCWLDEKMPPQTSTVYMGYGME